MKVEQIIKNLQQNGVELYVADGNTLKIRYDNGTLTQNDIERIRQHKAEIITLLSEKKPNRAQGYGCAACGNKIYRAIQSWETSNLPEPSSWTHNHRAVTYWHCESCGAVYELIGGSRGPKIIN
jgi:uncharacterized protein with PIN domain